MRELSRLFFGLAAALALVLIARPALAAPAAQQNVELMAELRGGDAEVPNPGDPDGTGTAMVTLDTTNNKITFTINASNITLPASASHIHEGASGASGPVVVPFTAPDANGMATGSVDVDAALMQRIQQNPAGFYVNVHTSDFPGGAIRGQLAPAGAQPAPGATAAPTGQATAAPTQMATTMPTSAATPVAGGAPSTLPNTGASDSATPLLAGFALFALAMGLGLRLFVRRRDGTR